MDGNTDNSDKKISPRPHGKFFSYIPLINFDDGGSPSISPISSRSHTPRSRRSSGTGSTESPHTKKRISGRRSRGSKDSMSRGSKDSRSRGSKDRIQLPPLPPLPTVSSAPPLDLSNLSGLPDHRFKISPKNTIPKKSLSGYEEQTILYHPPRRSSAPKHKTNKILDSPHHLDMTDVRKERHSHDGSMRHRRKDMGSPRPRAKSKYKLSYKWPDKKSIIYYEDTDVEYGMYHFAIDNEDDKMILCIPVLSHTISTYDLVVKDTYSAMTVFYDKNTNHIINVDESEKYHMINVYSKYWNTKNHHTFYPIYAKCSGYVCTTEQMVHLFPVIYEHIVNRKLRESR